MSQLPLEQLCRLRPLEGRKPGTLLVHEIYRSLQGEGAHVGLPCTFVRLTACHLRCAYCDTKHAFRDGDAFTIDETLGRVRELGADLVEITGGEPLLQEDIHELMARLVEMGSTVLLETSGALDISHVPPAVHIILDLKTPGSGAAEANLWANLDLLKKSDEVKFVVCDRADFDWSVDQVRTHRLTERCAVLVSPAYGQVEPARLASWVLETGLPLRLQVQLHKLLWGPDTRGV